MSTRAFPVVVVLLWCSTMSWLFIAKVMPLLRIGNPPADVSASSDVGWNLFWNDEARGRVMTHGVTTEVGVRELHSRLILDDLPLGELPPAWEAAVSWVASGRDDDPRIGLDARSRLEFDKLGKLTALHSSVKFGDMPSAIHMVGYREGTGLSLHVSLGTIEYETKLPIDQGMLIAREFSPQSDLGPLEVGQAWTVQSFSSFQFPSQAAEVLEAKVESQEVVEWNGKLVRTFVVVYRADAGAGLDRGAKPRSKLWVDAQGHILQQEVTLLDSQLRFVRMTDDEVKVHLADMAPPAAPQQGPKPGNSEQPGKAGLVALPEALESPAIH